MRIAVVVSPIIQCPPVNYGGIERIGYWVGRKLVEKGHEVTLFARTGSYLDGARVITYEGSENTEFAKIIADEHMGSYFDVIHDMTHDKRLSEKYSHYQSRIINSLQGMAPRGPNTTCISEAQRRDLGYSDNIPVIYHGIPVDEYPVCLDPTADYFLYMGSINDYKGVDIAIDICLRTKNKLIIAGPAWDSAYYDSLISKHCDGISIIWAGEVGGSAKLDLLANAKALLHPVRWTEPGAIIVGESLACGTPVIGSNNGVLPELINPAVGKICKVEHFDRGYYHMTGGCYDIDEWTHAVQTIDSIDRQECADYARYFLTDERMTNDYLECYNRIVNGENW